MIVQEVVAAIPTAEPEEFAQEIAVIVGSDPHKQVLVDSKTWLSSIAAVCRSWFHPCATLLFKKITVQLPMIDELLDQLRLPGDHISQHARFLTIQGGPSTVEYTQWARLLSRLPHVVAWRCMRADNALPYHHHQTRAISLPPTTATPFDNIEHLTLIRWTFISPSHLLDLLSRLPGLKSVTLHSVLFSGSNTPRTCRGPRHTTLRMINAMYCDNIALLAYSWAWSRSSSSQNISGATPGNLIDREARVAAKILASASRKQFTSQQLRIDISADCRRCKCKSIPAR